jgi:hypothetical protein
MRSQILAVLMILNYHEVHGGQEEENRKSSSNYTLTGKSELFIKHIS